MKKEYLFAGGAVICWSSVAPITKLLLNDMSSTTVLFLTTAIASLSLFGYNIVRGNRKAFAAFRPAGLPAIMCHGIYGIFRLQRRLLLRPYSAERTGRLRHHLSLAAGDSDFFLFYPEGNVLPRQN